MSHEHTHGHDHDYHHEKPSTPGTIDWRHNGVRVIKGDQLNVNIAQTISVNRAAAIDKVRVGARNV